MNLRWILRRAGAPFAAGMLVGAGLPAVAAAHGWDAVGLGLVGLAAVVELHVACWLWGRWGTR